MNVKTLSLVAAMAASVFGFHSPVNAGEAARAATRASRPSATEGKTAFFGLFGCNSGNCWGNRGCSYGQCNPCGQTGCNRGGYPGCYPVSQGYGYGGYYGVPVRQYPGYGIPMYGAPAYGAPGYGVPYYGGYPLSRSPSAPVIGSAPIPRSAGYRGMPTQPLFEGDDSPFYP